MKQLFILLAFIVSTISFQSLQAQDALNKWSVSLSNNTIANPIRVGSLLTNSDNNEFNEDFSTSNFDPAAFKLNVSRYLGRRISFGIAVSVNNITLNNDFNDTELPYISSDGMFKYNLSQGLTFNPYITLGGGYSWIDDIGSGTINGGLGFNIFVTNNFGFNVEGLYKHAFIERGTQHFQYSAGIILKFGARDKDKDGIKDSEDECPEEFGLLKFNGCPDTDKDGVKDSEDECPNIPGKESLKGCPDKDGDNVPDKFDNCPETPGSLQLKGCPDKDGDNVPDKFDRCPEQAGPNNNEGCPIPDSDGDGLNDRNDKCPNQAGPANNNGCPVPPKVNKQIFGRVVLFEYGKTELSEGSKRILDEVVKFMTLQNSKIFHVGGHADNTFDDDHNLKLSRSRAEIVKDYLIEKGIDEARLTIKGYGETRPLNPNDLESEEAKARNRRVEVFEIK